MPLNRPALALGPGPRSVQDARRWVVGTCQDIGRDDLVECAELGVSELVTNALLHAEAPISVRVRGTREHPRVEVRDGSRRRCRQLPATDDPRRTRPMLLLTFGRGLEHRRPRRRRLGRRASRTTARSSGSRRPPSSPRTRRRGPGHRRSRRRAADAADRRAEVDVVDSRSARRAGARLHRLPAATTASCAARSGCSPSPTRTTTRWPRTSPTCSARWTQPARRQVGPQQIEAALRRRARSRPTSTLTLPRRSPRRSSS